MRASFGLFVGLCLFIAACGGEPSLTEYAEEVEALVAGMNGRLSEIESDADGTNDLETIKWYARERVTARDAFLAGMDALEPPASLAELHVFAITVMSDLAAAEAALATRVDSLTTGVGVDAIWQTEEGVAALAANENAIELCYAAQAELDRTQARTDLDDASWMPSDMKEVVRVAFGCEPLNR